MEFMSLVFTRMPGGLTIGHSGLCCCVSCLSSGVISLHLESHILVFKTTETWQKKALTITVSLWIIARPLPQPSGGPKPIADANSSSSVSVTVSSSSLP